MENAALEIIGKQAIAIHRLEGEREEAEAELNTLREEHRYLQQAVRLFLTAPREDERLEARNMLLSLTEPREGEPG